MANGIDYLSAEIDSSKVIREDDDVLVVPITLTREGVVQYPHGKVLRPADELKRSRSTFEHAFITEKKHPQAKNPTGTAIDVLVTDPDQIVGHVEHVKIDLDAVDAKGRKSAKVYGEAVIYKHTGIDAFDNPSAASPSFLKGIAAGTIVQVSPGFIRDEMPEPGEWNGEKFQYTHRNIIGNHIAVGVNNARTKPPFIGVGVDSAGSNTDEMSAQDIEAKIAELQTKQSSLQQQLDLIYTDEMDQLNKIDKQIQEQFGKERDAIRKVTGDKTRELYQQMDNLRYEINAFREAKVQKEVGAQTQTPIQTQATSSDSAETPAPAAQPAASLSTGQLIEKVKKHVH